MYSLTCWNNLKEKIFHAALIFIFINVRIESQKAGMGWKALNRLSHWGWWTRVHSAAERTFPAPQSQQRGNANSWWRVGALDSKYTPHKSCARTFLHCLPPPIWKPIWLFPLVFFFFFEEKEHIHIHGFPDGASGKESTCHNRRPKWHGFNSWIRKILWLRKWQPIPVFLPGKFHGQRSLVDYSL